MAITSAIAIDPLYLIRGNIIPDFGVYSSMAMSFRWFLRGKDQVGF